MSIVVENKFGINLSIAYLCPITMDKETKQVSVQQYAKIVSKSRQWILYCIINGKPLPESFRVKSFEKIGRAYVITLN